MSGFSARVDAPRNLQSARLQALQRRYVWAVVVTPFVAFLVAVGTLWGPGVDLVPLILLIVMGVVSTLGIGVGFHRYFTHGAFECGPAVGRALAAFGSMAAEGPLIYWVATHRLHHQESDREHDPHSPNGFGPGLAGVLRGFWHAHTGWMFTTAPPNALRYAPDLLTDPVALEGNRLYPFWVLSGLMLPALVGGAVTLTWTGVWQSLLWAGFVRVFLVQHATWSVNSLCHMYGRQPYATGDGSRNNAWLAIPSFGESWHNNHHAFPSSAWHGLEWFEIDLSGLTIRGLARLGLAWNIVRPPATLIERKRAVVSVSKEH